MDMPTTLSKVATFLKKPEFLTIAVCIAWLLSGFFPEESRSVICGGAVVVIAVLALVSAFNSADDCQNRMRILQSHRYLVSETELIEQNSRGVVVGRIDLTDDFDVSIPFSGNAEGVYRVKQGDQSVEISSKAENAEHLVRDVLGIRTWPPDAKMNWP